MKLIAAFFFFLLTSHPLLAQWVRLEQLTNFSVIRSFVSTGTTLYANADGEGIFKTTDNGDTWTPVNTGLDTLFIQSMVGNANELFAGTGDGHIFRSSDEGATWVVTNAQLPAIPVSSMLHIGPAVYAASIGVILTTNSGQTWIPADEGLDPKQVTAMGVNGSTLFAIPFGNGVARSTDAGLTWSAANNGITNYSTISFGVLGTATFVSSYFDGVFKTTDNGATWEAANTGIDPENHPSYFATSGSNIFVGGDKVLYLSKDGGASWTGVPGLPASLTVYAMGVHNGMLFVQDAFTTWRRPLSELLDVGAHASEVFNVACTPNPANSNVTLRFTLPEQTHLSVIVTDPLGRYVLEPVRGVFHSGDHVHGLNVSALSAGIYYCHVRSRTFAETTSFVISR